MSCDQRCGHVTSVVGKGVVEKPFKDRGLELGGEG